MDALHWLFYSPISWAISAAALIIDVLWRLSKKRNKTSKGVDNG
jgi:hypothetical protein